MHSEAHRPARTARVTGPGAADHDLLTTLLGGMDSALLAVDTAGRITHWNDEAERMLGWTRAEAVGRAGLGGWAVRDADAADVGSRLLAAAGAPARRQVEEFPLVRKDGVRVLVRAQVSAVSEPGGRPAGAYCVFSEVHRQLALERTVALSEALLGDSPWAVVLVDADLRTVSVNEQATRALAVSAVDMLGEPLAEFFDSGLEELESALEHALAGHPQDGPVELWVTLHDDGSYEDSLGEERGGLPGGRRRCWLSGFLRLGSPLSTEASPLGVAWVFQDVTRPRRSAREAARQRFRDSQLNRATRAAADCEEPLDAAALHLEFALAGFAEHALLDLRAPGRSGDREAADSREHPGGTSAGAGRPEFPEHPEDPGPERRLVRVAEAPGAACGSAVTPGVPVRYRPGHPAVQALERGVPVRATAGASLTADPAGPVLRPEWAAEHQWPLEAEHALCVVLRSRGRNLGVVTFLRGARRRGFDRADVTYAEDVGLRIAAAVDLDSAGHSRPRPPGPR
ncbi:PAS domain-containing protein [Streptomyces sp. ACA25]|uniref:PAS domain-containing protein n=1 Tax=Streptomyces sp. ACA25 TaxID=3022596 RepID=UPI0023075150|nr:PAS domain-containing protein [Streptomyces sp. ACA25]MDB1088164.1 PAS domain-containing protein [Streptomyces sp. ACA25]